jgi:hypothetical protein
VTDLAARIDELELLAADIEQSDAGEAWYWAGYVRERAQKLRQQALASEKGNTA